MGRTGKYLCLIGIGGSLYYVFEQLFRGFSHWSMFLLGGICFLFIYLQGSKIGWDEPLWKQILRCDIFVVSMEFMTGIKYLNFIADIFGIPSDVRLERIRKYADLFELTDDLAEPIAAYSHGMKQKLAIISAWLHAPKLVIMDEPFVGLDPKASHILKGMMRELCDQGGAIFFSTHVLEVAEKLCDKVAIIKGGKLIRFGTMEEVRGDDSLEEVFLELEDESC